LIPAPSLPRGALANRSRFGPAVLETVNARLTAGAPLPRSAETIQQSLSGNPCGQLAAVRLKDSSMSRAASTASLRNRLRRFRRSQRGSTAVEFALVAPVFFALLFAIVETALVFFASQVLETVTQESARQIMTGQAQAAGLVQADFKTKVVCPVGSLASVLFGGTCTNLYIDVESYPAFTNVTINSQIDAGGNFVPPTGYSLGGPGDIVVVRMFYQWPLFVTGFGYNISNLAGNQRLLVATAAFKNEPF
jgi:Flp pilus assembly protein TadG